MEELKMAEEATNVATAGAENAGTATETNAATENAAQGNEGQDKNTFLTDEVKKHIQSEIDKGLAEERKKNANLQKENEKLKKEQMSAEELKKYEAEKRDKELTERDKVLTERENRLFAIEAIKEIGLDDGSKQSLDLVDFVMAADQSVIKDRVKAFKELVDRFVTSKVNETFKANGRVPNGGNSNNGDTKTDSIAAKLGKQAAETAKKSNEILKHYYGG